jgi:glucose-6-phosphate isomerase
MLATDDEAVIAAVITAGTLFGMLLQYSDDLFDEPTQANAATLTLQRALVAAHPSLEATEATGQASWMVLHTAYSDAISKTIAPLPVPTRQTIEHLLRESFGSIADETAELLTAIQDAP